MLDIPQEFYGIYGVPKIKNQDKEAS